MYMFNKKKKNRNIKKLTCFDVDMHMLISEHSCSMLGSYIRNGPEGLFWACVEVLSFWKLRFVL